MFVDSGRVPEHANEVNEPSSDELKPSSIKLNLKSTRGTQYHHLHSLVVLDLVVPYLKPVWTRKSILLLAINLLVPIKLVHASDSHVVQGIKLYNVTRKELNYILSFSITIYNKNIAEKIKP